MTPERYPNLTASFAITLFLAGGFIGYSVGSRTVAVSNAERNQLEGAQKAVLEEERRLEAWEGRLTDREILESERAAAEYAVCEAFGWETPRDIWRFDLPPLYTMYVREGNPHVPESITYTPFRKWWNQNQEHNPRAAISRPPSPDN